MPRKQQPGDAVVPVPSESRKRRKQEPEPAVDPEREQDAWDEFAADYYEIVEQLPLELHRNFALLRELDDQTQHHTANLLTQLRNYISRRLPALHPPPSSNTTWPDKPPPAPEAIDIGIPESDGHGGLLVPPMEPLANGEGELKSTTEPQSRGFPTRDPQRSPKRHEPERSPRKPAHELLPEVAKLSREMVRGAEEKVALAQGAYNTIDRHIRSLDSALVNSESALQLGIRPFTHPSSTIEPPVGSTWTLPQADPNELTIGLGGGGGSRKKGKNGKKRGHQDVVHVPTQGHGPLSSAVAVTGGIVPAAFDLAVDPNEPRYCYCQQVSYGEMIGCENEECPLEWFHLACAGLTAAPTGKWWCDICRPKVGKSAAHRKR